MSFKFTMTSLSLTLMLSVLLSPAISLAEQRSAEELLSTASSPNQAEAVRQNAFIELVELGATEFSLVLKTAQSDDAGARERWVAIRVLGKLRSPEADAVLVRLLRDSKADVRTAAASALGDTGNTRYVIVLSDRLEDDAIIVRASAAEALGKLGSKDAVPALDRALLAPSNHYRGSSLWVRRHYVKALKDLAHKDSYPTLLRCLDDEDPKVVEASLAALEATAGFSMSEGRDRSQELEAWRRWIANQLR